EARVLEGVQRGVRDRGVVRGGYMPGRERGEPERERDPRPDEERRDRPERAPCKSAERTRGEEEEGDRAAQPEHEEEGADVAEQEVLAHVGGQELVLADRVERRDDGEERDRDARRVQQRVAPP